MAVQGRRGFGSACSSLHGVFALVIRQTSTARLASRMLARFGVRAIWDTHVAAAAAFGLGKPELADELVEIAEAAEREWDALYEAKGQLGSP
jgi:hypothetical protein